ncbi:MAG: lipase maturation factor family protein [Anaerolineae bacterium]|nr:lipase maturation factor family protein [Anaerolineae bacterium]
MTAGDVPMRPPTNSLTRWLFLRALAIIYFIAFASLAAQILGLVGSGGILPIRDTLQTLQNYYGPQAYNLFPSLVWWNASDGGLLFLTHAGMILSVLLLLDIAPLFSAALLWGLYLSLVTAGQIFLRYQWDLLLLETGFLAILLAPPHIVPRRSAQRSPSPLNIWLLRWLLFRLMFSSGVVKLTSGDPTWANLTALTYHYTTQPLPTPLAWFMHQLPLPFQQASAAFMFGVELILPLFIFGPRRLRWIAAAGIAALQVLIALTGNYTFFNLLALALCIPLLDDAFLRRLLPGVLTARFDSTPVRLPAYRRALLGLVAALVFALGGIQMLYRVIGRTGLPEPVLNVVNFLAPLRIANSYGLFAVMTTTRPEILVEGSNDGQTWQAYRFKDKPGDLQRPPPWVAPHQPRLDWQMWFAALGPPSQSPWFSAFVQRLLEGKPDVLALLETNPFPDAPPRYVRAQLYDYQFTTMEERSQTGAWWTRQLIGEYVPATALAR